MGVINITSEERDCLDATSADELLKLIEQSIESRRPSPLRHLPLESCGPYVASRLRAFERALADYGAAKAAKKIAATESVARRAGSDLGHAVVQMKHRANEEEIERELFYVDDIMIPPHQLSEHLTVSISYRWRQTREDRWQHGSITFTHDVVRRPDYDRPPASQKSNPNKQEVARQERLYDEWERLRQLGLFSVRDFFRAGGAAAAMPTTFEAKADPHTRGLNNFSAQFWLESA